MTGFRTRNVLGVPVVNSKGWTVGAVQADNSIDGVLDGEDARVLRAVAVQIGVSVLLDS